MTKNKILGTLLSHLIIYKVNDHFYVLITFVLTVYNQLAAFIKLGFYKLR